MTAWLAECIGRLLPERCPLCGGATSRGLCMRCRAALPSIAAPCAGCGLPRPVACCPRRLGPWHLVHLVAPWAFATPLDAAIHALKFRGQRTLGRALGLSLAAELGAAASRVDMVVAVPLHRTRLLERGYNQASEIARPIARALRLPLLVAGVMREVSATPQTQLSASERVQNMRGAFRVRRQMSGHRIALVDDVVTTGATLNALARALYASGAEHVEGWALARTLPSR